MFELSLEPQRVTFLVDRELYGVASKLKCHVKVYTAELVPCAVLFCQAPPAEMVILQSLTLGRA